MNKSFICVSCFLIFALFPLTVNSAEVLEKPLSWSINSIQIVWEAEGVVLNELVLRTARPEDPESLEGNSFEVGESDSLKRFVPDSTGCVTSGPGWMNFTVLDENVSSQWNEMEQTNLGMISGIEESLRQEGKKFTRKLVFVVDFMNHTDEEFRYEADASNHSGLIPVYCGTQVIGNAIPQSKSFRIPPIAETIPCRFEMKLSESALNSIFELCPQIEISKGQMILSSSEVENAILESSRVVSHFTVRLMNETESLQWQIAFSKKKPCTFSEALEAINELYESDIFDLSENGQPQKVAGVPTSAKRHRKNLVLCTWDGGQIDSLSEASPKRNRNLDFYLISTETLETLQSIVLVKLIPFRDWLERQAEDEAFDDSCLAWNLAENQQERLEEGIRLAEAGSLEAQFEVAVIYYFGRGVKADIDEFTKWCTKAAENGHALAQYTLGFSYSIGRGVEIDDEKAFTWFEKAAEQNYPAALRALGKCYGLGLGTEKDSSKAVECFTKAAIAGDAEAQFCLASHYLSGIGVEKDEEGAFFLYKKAADQFYPQAMRKLAECYERGIGVTQNYQEALIWYIKAANEGDPEAQTTIALKYLSLEDNVELNQQETFLWLSKAAAQRYPDAEVLLGRCYLRGVGIQRDFNQAFQWFQKAAEDGSAIAYCELGDCYLFGSGVEKDEKKAVKMYRIAAEKGDPEAQCRLGARYARGEGVREDMTEARIWYQKAADQGHVSGLKNLAFFYINGLGGEQDTDEGIELYTQAANLGDVESQAFLGAYYRLGLYVKQNDDQAFYWTQKAVEQNYVPAMTEMGLLYHHGIGTPKDDKQSTTWFLKAAEQGDGNAMYYLGMNYMYGLGTEVREDEAVRWIQEGAKVGNANSQTLLGDMYSEGFGSLEQDFEESMKWYSKAAEQNNDQAQFNLALCYWLGVGTKVDIQKACDWAEKSANFGNTEAMCFLAARYTHGDGPFPKNPKKGLSLLKKAAELNSPAAEYYLGLAYLDGTDVERDTQKGTRLIAKSAEDGFKLAQTWMGNLYSKDENDPAKTKIALEWYQKAAEQNEPIALYQLGSFYLVAGTAEEKEKGFQMVKLSADLGTPDAQFMTAVCYERGLGVETNMTEAMRWYRIAAKNGNQNAQKFLKELEGDDDKGDDDDDENDKTFEEIEKELDDEIE